MRKNKKELSTVYWSGLVVPFVICTLVLSSIAVILTSNVGAANPAMKAKFVVPRTK
jgi:hypothetical protein